MKPLLISLLALLLPLLIAAGFQGCAPVNANPYDADYHGTHVTMTSDRGETFDCIWVDAGMYGDQLLNCVPLEK